MKNPVSTCRQIIEYIHEMTELIRMRAEQGGTGTTRPSNVPINHRFFLFQRRSIIQRPGISVYDDVRPNRNERSNEKCLI